MNAPYAPTGAHMALTSTSAYAFISPRSLLHRLKRSVISARSLAQKTRPRRARTHSMIKIEKMSTGSAKRKPSLVAVPRKTSDVDAPIVIRRPAQIEGRCNCFDVTDVDEYDAPKSYPERLRAFVADLIAHGAVVEEVVVVKTPAVAKARRRVGS